MIINVERSSNRVKDVNQTYDVRRFDNAAYPDGTIPDGENPQHYKRLPDGTIAKATQQEIEQRDPNELLRRLKGEFQAAVAQLAADIGAQPPSPQRQILINLLRLVRTVATIQRLE